MELELEGRVDGEGFGYERWRVRWIEIVWVA